MTFLTRLVTPLFAALVSSAAAAQNPPPDDVPAAARAALQACMAAVQESRPGAARREAARAAALFERWIAAEADAAEPRVGLAGVRLRCELPYADALARGALAGRAGALLEEALRLDPTHWQARFTVAMTYVHAPPMMGTAEAGIRHLEILVEQQGDGGQPHHALAHLALGDAYAGRGDEARAHAAWRRGLALFPADARFQEKLHGGTDGPRAAAPVLLDALVVQGGSRMDDVQTGMDLRRVDVVTTPGATADLMQAFQTQPGTTRAGEGSDLYVRGGHPAEASVLLNGARLLYAGRYENLNGGAVGILDSSVLRGAYFSSGGFSARYGNALSGVLDVQTVGRPAVRMTRVNVNTVQAGGVVDLPVTPDAGVWGTLRASDARLMLAMHGRGAEFAEAPRAREAMVGAAWEPRDGAELRLVVLADADEAARNLEAYGWTGPFRSRGANRLATLSGRTLAAGDRLGLRGTVSGASRTSGFRFGVLDRTRTDRSAAGRLDADARVPGGQVRAGVEAAWMDAALHGTVPASDRMAPGSPAEPLPGAAASTVHLGGYLEHERQLGAGVGVVAGLRADRLPGEARWTTDPRIALGARTGAWTLRVGGGRFHQGRWRTGYRVPDAGTPAGVPVRATHAVVAATRDGEPSLRVEGYLKRYGGYAPEGPGPAIESGRAAGVDAIVRWTRQPRVNGWITYGYLDGTLRLAEGGVVPSAVDVRHSLTGVARVTLSPGWEVGSTARLASGRPHTPVLGAVDDGEGGPLRPLHGPVHGERLPPLHRLDGRLTRYHRMTSGVGVAYLEVLNLLDRANVAGYTYDAGFTRRRPVETFYSTRTLVLGMGVTF